MRNSSDLPVNVTIRQETSPLVLRDIFRLRAFVWRQLSNDSQYYNDEWTDNIDARAVHWAVYVDGRLAAAARMSVHDQLRDIPDLHIFEGLNLSIVSPIASINRLVVHPDFRALGLSRQLDTLRLDSARNNGCRTMIALASKLSGIKRLQALQKLGFRPVAPAYSLRNWDWVTPLVMSLQP